MSLTDREPRTSSTAVGTGQARGYPANTAGVGVSRFSRAVSATRVRVHDRWAVALIVVTWAWVVLPRLVQSVTAPKFLSSIGTDTPTFGRTASLTLTVLSLALAALCFLIIIDVCRDPHPGRIAVLALLLAPWVYLVVRDAYAGERPTKAALMYPLVVAAFWMLRPKVQVLRTLGYLVGLSAGISIALAVVLPSQGIAHTSVGALYTQDKTILPMGVLIGFLSQGNNLGQFLALGIPLMTLAPRRWWRWALISVSLFALVWSSSRSSLLAIGFAVLAWAVIRLTPGKARGWVATLVALLPFGLVCLLPFITSDARAFTNRGGIWQYSLYWWHTRPFVGLGADWYQRIGSTSQRLAGSVFHGHNQFVQLAVTGGVVLVVLVGLQVVGVSVRSGRMAVNGLSIGSVYLATLAGTCVLEKSFAFVDNTMIFPLVVVPMAVLMFGDYGTSREVKTPEVTRRRHRPETGRRYSVTV